MTDKLELKSSHEVIYTVDVADVESIFYCKPTDPNILTVLMKDGKRLYCDEVCPIDSLPNEPVSKDLEEEIEEYWKNAPTGTVYFPMWEYFQIIAHHFAEWGKKQSEIEMQAQSMALAHGCPKEELANKDLEEAAKNHAVERYRATRDMVLAEKCKWSFNAGANWQKEQDKETIELAEDHAMLAGMEKMKEQMMKNIWKPADGDGLPEIDKEVIVLTQKYPLKGSKYAVSFAHRPYKGKYIGKSLTTGNIETFENETYDKGGWNIPNVKFWLDAELPTKIEL